jgi:hypothetical protein
VNSGDTITNSINFSIDIASDKADKKRMFTIVNKAVALTQQGNLFDNREIKQEWRIGLE